MIEKKINGESQKVHGKGSMFEIGSEIIMYGFRVESRFDLL